MEVAAMEASPDAEGRLHFYDVNINTNYNAEAEARLGNERQGMRPSPNSSARSSPRCPSTANTSLRHDRPSSSSQTGPFLVVPAAWRL